MKLAEYQKQFTISDAAIAGATGLTRSMIYKIRQFCATPSLETAFKINAFTDGNVTPFELLSPEKKANLVKSIQKK